MSEDTMPRAHNLILEGGEPLQRDCRSMQPNKGKGTYKQHRITIDDNLHLPVEEIGVKKLRCLIPQLYVEVKFGKGTLKKNTKIKGLWDPKNKIVDWPANLPFMDPNNRPKPKAEVLRAMYVYLKATHIKKYGRTWEVNGTALPEEKMAVAVLQPQEVEQQLQQQQQQASEPGIVEAVIPQSVPPGVVVQPFANTALVFTGAEHRMGGLADMEGLADVKSMTYSSVSANGNVNTTVSGLDTFQATILPLSQVMPLLTSPVTQQPVSEGIDLHPDQISTTFCDPAGKDMTLARYEQAVDSGKGMGDNVKCCHQLEMSIDTAIGRGDTTSLPQTWINIKAAHPVQRKCDPVRMFKHPMDIVRADSLKPTHILQVKPATNGSEPPAVAPDPHCLTDDEKWQGSLEYYKTNDALGFPNEQEITDDDTTQTPSTFHLSTTVTATVGTTQERQKMQIKEKTSDNCPGYQYLGHSRTEHGLLSMIIK